MKNFSERIGIIITYKSLTGDYSWQVVLIL